MSHSGSSEKTNQLSRNEAAVLPLDQIRLYSVTEFAVYGNQEGILTLLKNPGHHWESTDRNMLLSGGYSTLYYHTRDSAKVNAYLKFANLPAIDVAFAPRDRVLAITDVAAELTKICFAEPITESTFAKGREIATHLLACIEEDRTCVAALGKLAHHDWYTYYHSARVATYALALAMEMGLTNETQLQYMAIGCLFHDIGKTRIDINILNKDGPLTSHEWRLMRQHPELGEVVVYESDLGHLSRQIILHHHERLDGAGYPHMLSAADIITEVRIAAFADTFDALTTNRPYQPGRTKYEALDFIRHRFLEQLDRECYKAMVALLNRAGNHK
jgi:putative nucleotidyltransferase with HDIG domain